MKNSSYTLYFMFLFCVFLCANAVAQAPLPVLMQPSIPHTLYGLYSSQHPSSFHKTDNKHAEVLLPAGFPMTEANTYKEDKTKRTLYSRTFTNGKSGIVIHQSSTHLNYLDKQNTLQPIEAKLSAYARNGYSQKVWAAIQQQFPTYLNEDGSTSLTTDDGSAIIFNRYCMFNNKLIQVTDFTVGEDGMLINNAVEGVVKKMVFTQNAIESDYMLLQPIDIVGNELVITEELELPDGYTVSVIPVTSLPKEVGGMSTILNDIETNIGAELRVLAPNGTEQAHFKQPVFYDANKIAMKGSYSLVLMGGKYSVEIHVPKQWLNAPDRAYPVTIDPLVTGPTSNYPFNFMNSCASPSYAKDSMLVTIPAGITINGFIVEDSYFADALSTPPALMTHGTMLLASHCGSVTFSCQGTAADSSGYCYLNPNTDVSSNLACCFAPSCTAQTFYLTHGLTRNSYGTGCNQTYIYYSPNSQWPFSAFITGNTVGTTQAQWFVSPTTICSDSCTISLKITTQNGVPPYTISHPWASAPDQYGAATDGCNTMGMDTILLHIPNCPATCGTGSTLAIPPPSVMDACGDTVSGLMAKTITFKPVPTANSNAQEVCSGAPIDITLSSCVSGSTFQWAGTNGTSGTGNITGVSPDTVTSPFLIHYAVIPTAAGCVGDTLNVTLQVDPLPIVIANPGDTIDPGVAVPFAATGALTYTWTPSTALSCAACATPIATPVVSTSYTVAGTNEYGCTAYDTVDIIVNQGSEVLYIPNTFTPNNNGLNDKFMVYGTSIKKIDLRIYDRWGEELFHSNDITTGWDGTFHGKDVEPGLYVYKVICEFMSNSLKQRTGTITIFR